MVGKSQQETEIPLDPAEQVLRSKRVLAHFGQPDQNAQIPGFPSAQDAIRPGSKTYTSLHGDLALRVRLPTRRGYANDFTAKPHPIERRRHAAPKIIDTTKVKRVRQHPNRVVRQDRL
jgi:hypothetical protein